ncbi:glutamyl-tRNA reductase [bacterium]|nr:glutamyl-tRNA reductase [bacterium]
MGGIKKSHFFMTGISHKTAEVELREKVSISPDSLGAVLKGLKSIRGVSECVVLSTCNRTELYTVLSEPVKKVRGLIERYILSVTGQEPSMLDRFYRFQGMEVVEHLFMVTCGLDSMIIGEPQIFGQVKNAYSAACDHLCTGPVFNRLFHHTFRVGKLARNTTSIGEGAVSVSYAAVELARKVFGTLDGRSVLLVGAGKIGELCARQLVNSGVERLYVSNRTALRAADLAGRVAGETIPFDKIAPMSSSVDIILSSVASCSPVMKTSDFLTYMQARKNSPLFIIDLGVPRNVEPDASDTDRIVLYNIDDLEDVIFGNRDKRKSEAEKAKKLIVKEVEEFRSWLSERTVIPVIQRLRERCESIRQEELDKVRNRINPEAFKTLDLVTRRVVRKILHNPTITMRAAASESSRERLVNSVRELFIDEKNE